MHGRLKVRTTEEERERKKKEQALKVKAYKAAMAKIQDKRQKHIFDDEMLLLTSQILLRNPDVATLWNIRRECVEDKAKQLHDDEDKLQSVYDIELGITEQCLMVNPKSYGGWHHRCWTLEHCPRANWDREVQLCNKYLKMDERNFHTWDYRRYVVAKAGVGKQEELDFCTEKIKVNFSNYSSWHYRSLLLPDLHPYDGDALPKRPMSEEKLKEELEMVLTAAFTDPNDSSAWFYQRWLLGYSRAELDICAFRCDHQKAVVAFTHPIPFSDAKIILSSHNNECRLELNDWHSDNKTKMDTIWIAMIPSSNNLGSEFGSTTAYRLQLEIPSLTKNDIPVKCDSKSIYYLNPPNRSFAYSPSVLEELQSQLESCESLLEYEPDSKWTLLTSALIMRAIDNQKYHEKSLVYLDKLQKVDALRQGYYKDLASKWILEKLLCEWSQSDAIPKTFDLDEQPQLSSLYYTQYFCIADEVVLTAALKESYENGKKELKTFHKLKL